MGTSASNGGPKGSPPLLPDWYPDAPAPPAPEPPAPEPPQPEPVPNPEEQPQPVPEQPVPASTPTGDWKTAKGALTRLSNSTGGSSGRKAAGRYLNSLGGARAATRAAAQGIGVGSRYAGFLGTLGATGINGTLNSLGLGEFIGRSPDEICAAIANALAPAGATNDEAIARDALISTLDALYTSVLDAGGNLDNLNALSPELIKETLITYVSNFIFAKWMYELGNAIERGNISEQQAIALERDVKDLIVTETTEQYREVDLTQINLHDASNTNLISDIFETAYSILEP